MTTFYFILAFALVILAICVAAMGKLATAVFIVALIWVGFGRRK